MQCGEATAKEKTTLAIDHSNDHHRTCTGCRWDSLFINVKHVAISYFIHKRKQEKEKVKFSQEFGVKLKLVVA